MDCPTCSHTMENIEHLECRFQWCPRCGTLNIPGLFEPTTVPKLVARCRAFEKCITLEGELIIWTKLGIRESINVPGDRP
jgi:hypothetical protein